ncbi:MAG: RNA polymerase sigma factor [Nannocystales bacterium]
MTLAIAHTDQPPPLQETSLERARSGDATARAELYREHAATVTRRLAHACGDDELARDIAQDAFITAFARLDRFGERASFSTWLHGIAFNHLRDRRKRNARERAGKAQLALAEGGATASPEQHASSRQVVAKLDAVLATLAPKLRDAFVLRVVEQLSLEESAEILGARIATVSYRARKAEALVRAAFEDGGEG